MDFRSTYVLVLASAIGLLAAGCQESDTVEFTIEPRYFSAGQFRQIIETSKLPSPTLDHHWSFPTEYGVVPPIPRVGEHVIKMVHDISTQDVRDACSGRKTILIERQRAELAHKYSEGSNSTEHARRAADSLEGMRNLYGVYCSAMLYANYSQIKIGADKDAVTQAYIEAGCSIPDTLEQYSDVIPYRDILFRADIDAELLQKPFADVLEALWSETVDCSVGP